MVVLNLGGPGVWWLHSIKDERWNCSGITEKLCGYYPPDELSKKLDDLNEKLGDRPEDLRWGVLPADFIGKVMEVIDDDPETLRSLVGLTEQEVKRLPSQS